MLPQHPVPIMGTDPNITGMPMGPMGGIGQYTGPMLNSPENFVYIEDPFSEIAQCTGAIIHQQPSLLEAVTGCSTQNRYHVFLQSPFGIKYAFKCNEFSDTCARCCLSANARPLKITMRHVLSYQEFDTDLSKVFISIDKPCQCACLCMCRPYMDVRLTDNGQRLGHIREPCTCCDVELEVYDANGALRYDIYGDGCQMGLCCSCCSSTVQKLSTVRFDIRQNGMPLGTMSKMGANIGEFFTKADSYQIIFPPQATPADKILLIIAGLMIDYQNFEKNDNEPHNYYYNSY